MLICKRRVFQIIKKFQSFSIQINVLLKNYLCFTFSKVTSFCIPYIGQYGKIVALSVDKQYEVKLHFIACIDKLISLSSVVIYQQNKPKYVTIKFIFQSRRFYERTYLWIASKNWKKMDQVMLMSRHRREPTQFILLVIKLWWWNDENATESCNRSVLRY